MPILTVLTNNLLNNNNNSNCCCNACGNNVVVRRRRDNITTQNARIAQFTTVGSQLVGAVEIIPLSNTQFNNISSYVQLNNNGTIDILTQGVYKIEYVAVIQNNSDSTQTFTLQLESNGSPIALTIAQVTLDAGQYATLTNQIILPVFVGTTRNISLVNSSTQEVVVINANIIVTKLT